MPRRRRGLSAEDRKLWEAVAATTTPLHPAGAPPPPPAPEPANQPSPAAPAPAARPPRRAPRPSEAPRVTLDLAPDPHTALDALHPRMDRRRFERLRRGQLDPEARIDLHGMTSERAHAALTGFILDAHAAGLRLVLVITGKGRPDAEAMQPHRQGILRHSLPHWLGAPLLRTRILDIVPAHQRHGGGGAYYVYLRRQRS